MEQGGKMRLTLVTLGTTAASLAVIGNAFYQKKQFYPSVVFLTKSNPSVAVLYAQAFVLVFLFGKAMRKIFFGQLRASEVEHLIEKFWYVITETCLAFTVFRDDFSARFVALFTFLLFMKAFHWLIEDRVDYMERCPIIRFIFHIRVIGLLIILGTIDSILIHHAFKTTVASGASVQMVFGFEYAILLTMVVATLMKYSIHVIDSVIEHQWENRNVFLLYGELVTGFVKCCLYLAFVVVMVKIHTFPLFAIRPMYLTIRAFKKSLSDVILSRRAIAYMNTRFPNVELEELIRLDVTTCIICRERLTIGKKLPCNHIFHTHCLRSWFQRQQSCPTCRMDILSNRRPTNLPNQPPQPPQNQPQPPQAPMPPGPHGFMNMPPFGMFPPPPPPQQPPQGTHSEPSSPQQTTSMTQPTYVSTSTTSSTTTQPTSGVNPSMAAFNFPPMTQTSFPMFPNTFSQPIGIPPFFPPPPPPFMANLDTSGLSVDQLLEMEGQERENVEARIRVLRNVHSLLDAVILQLNQYSNVINTLNAVNHSSGVQKQSAQTPFSDDIVKPSTSKESQNESKSDVEDIDFARLTGSFSDEVIASASGLITEENELRQRRLDRFESMNKENNNEENELN